MVEDFALYFTFSLIFPILILLGYIMAKIIIKRRVPENNYTPFDYIMGQGQVEFHEQKEVKEEEDGQGDDKNKNKKNRG